MSRSLPAHAAFPLPYCIRACIHPHACLQDMTPNLAYLQGVTGGSCLIKEKPKPGSPLLGSPFSVLLIRDRACRIMYAASGYPLAASRPHLYMPTPSAPPQRASAPLPFAVCCSENFISHSFARRAFMGQQARYIRSVHFLAFTYI